MKHFGHDCDALDDPRIMDLMAEHGLAGYGFYFSCLELIGQKIKSNNVTCELQYSPKTLAFKFRTELGLTKDYLSTCLGLGLFWQDPRDNKVYCFKMLSRIEKNVAQNHSFKELLGTFYNSDLYQYYLSTNQGLKKAKIVPKEVSSEVGSKEVKELKKELSSKDSLPATSTPAIKKSLFESKEYGNGEDIDILKAQQALLAKQQRLGINKK